MNNQRHSSAQNFCGGQLNEWAHWLAARAAGGGVCSQTYVHIYKRFYSLCGYAMLNAAMLCVYMYVFVVFLRLPPKFPAPPARLTIPTSSCVYVCMYICAQACAQRRLQILKRFYVANNFRSIAV